MPTFTVEYQIVVEAKDRDHAIDKGWDVIENTPGINHDVTCTAVFDSDGEEVNEQDAPPFSPNVQEFLDAVEPTL